MRHRARHRTRRPRHATKLTLDDIADLRAYERERERVPRPHHRAQEAAPRPRRARSSRSCSRTATPSASRSRRWPGPRRSSPTRASRPSCGIYNPLIPEPGHLAATMFIELTRDEQLREWLPKLVGIERRVELRLGDGRRRRRGALHRRSRPREAAHPRRDHGLGPLRPLRLHPDAGRARSPAGPVRARRSTHPEYRARDRRSSADHGRRAARATSAAADASTERRGAPGQRPFGQAAPGPEPTYSPTSDSYRACHLRSRAVPDEPALASQAACQGLDPIDLLSRSPTRTTTPNRPRRVCASARCVSPASSTRSASARRKASGAAPPSASAGASSANAAARPDRRDRRLDGARRRPGRAARWRLRRASGGWRAVLVDADRRVATSPAAQAAAAMGEILAGDATPAQIAAFIVALRMKGEAVDEVSGMVDAMLDAAAPIDAARPSARRRSTSSAPAARRAGGSTPSTCRPWPASSPPAPGCTVCKHGNRKASSTSGSFDLLEALGVRASSSTARPWPACVDEAGVGFCFARAFHPAMRHAGPVRAELGVPDRVQLPRPAVEPGAGAAVR